MATNTFDILVLGDELSGLIAATLCAARGYRVGLIAGDSIPTDYKSGDFVLPVEPFSLVGLDSPAISAAVDELHFTHDLRRRIRPTRIPFQLVTPKARLDVGADDVILLRELDRELGANSNGFDRTRKAGEVARALDAAFEADSTLPATSYRGKREQARLLATIHAEAEALFDKSTPELIRTLWLAPAAISSATGGEQPDPMTALRSFELWRQGVPRFEGDATGLRNLLLEKFKASGGELLDEVRVVELTYSWGKVSGVATKAGDELGATQVIAAMPIDELFVLAGSKGQKKIEGNLDDLQPSGYRYTLNLVIDEAGIPEGMADTVLCVVDPSKPLVGSNLLAIFVGEPDDRARVIVSVSAICPQPADSSHLEAEFASLRVGMRESLEMVMPFVGQHTLLVHSPHESLPAEGKAAKPGPAVGKPVPARPLWKRKATEGTEHVTLAGVPYQIGLKNVVLASEQVLPGLGLEGQFAVALGATKIACAAVGKRKTPRGEILGR